MAMKVESVDDNGLGIKVEGDLGSLQIIEESSDSDDDIQGEQGGISTVSCMPKDLVQASSAPVVGSLAITNSDNVQIGNNTYFNGPVTIKQVIGSHSGIENRAYIKTEDENVPGLKSPSNNDYSDQKCDIIPTWQKFTFLGIGAICVAALCAVIIVLVNSAQSNSSDSNYEFSTGDNSNILVVGLYAELKILIISVSVIPIIYVLINCLILTAQVFNSGNTLGAWYKRNNFKKSTKNRKDNEADNLLVAPGHLRIVSRIDWLAQPVDEVITKIKQPVPWVIITHTATGSCHSQSACVLNVRLLQTFHIESRGWSDIGYNFMVGGDGSAYYGRGWDYVGAHTKGYNNCSMGIAFIGTFNTESPTKNQVEACKNLIKLGVAEGKLAKDYKLFAHRQLMSTLSPGDKVYEIISKWPHFVKTTDDQVLYC